MLQHRRFIVWTRMHSQKRIEERSCIDLDYADDICLLIRRYHDIKGKLDSAQAEASKSGIIMNIGKTNAMRINAPNTACLQIMNHAGTFCYLGSMLTTAHPVLTY